ncbi:MAG: hypothetical protein JWN89_267 [Parcubacteria group bacterium]|nr:hypothetical protein [Parcubacteria group bacterium]
MLFKKENRKKLQTIWVILSVLMIISIVALYLPSLFR